MHTPDPTAAPDRGPHTRIAVATPVPLPSTNVRDAYGPAGYGVGEDNSNGFARTLFGYWRLLLKRKWLILGVALGCLGLGTMITLMQTPLYTATVRLQIDRDVAKVVEEGGTAPTEQGFGTEFLKTQYELLMSRSLAERVVSSARLDTDEEFLKPASSLLGGVINFLRGMQQDPVLSAADAKRIATDRVLRAVVVRPVAASRLVDVTFTDRQPQLAQRVANAYGDSFVAANLDKRFSANAYAKTFLEDQLKQLKIRLEDSEQAVLDFAERERIVDVSDKASIAENNLASANVALGTLISERIKNEEQWRQVDKSNVINLPQLLSNTVIDGLRARRNILVTDYQEKLETFKPSYPEMQQLTSKIKEIDRQLAKEVDTIRASLKGAFESSFNQEVEMKKRIEVLRAEVLDLQKRGIRYNSLKRDAETNRGLYNGLLQRFKEVDVAAGVGSNNVFIVDAAIEPRVPSSPQVFRSLILSLLIGTALGLGIAYILELFDDKIRIPEEVEQLSGLAMLGVVPLADFENDKGVDDPRSPISEAYRSLATALTFSTDAGAPRSITVTSAGPSEGKSTTALAVARQFAIMGLRVLLVDADLRKPSLHLKLGQDNSRGLSNYLTGAASPPDVLQATSHPNLAFMASGPMPPNAADLLSGTRIYSLISVGLEVFDLIVIDGPPVMGLADAQLLSNAAAATIFVVGAGESRAGMIRNALRRLQMSRGTIIGFVMTKFDAKAAGYGYGYGYSDYSYATGAYDYGRSADADPVALPRRRAG
jgi:polysaccharide biosynthesis transport protein